MPVSHAMKQLPGGELYVRTVQSGKVTGAAAERLVHLMGPGQPLHGLPVLSVVESGAEFDPEARKLFIAMGDPARGARSPRVAVVVTSPPLRMMMSFITRLSGAAEVTRFFVDEADAQAWLGATARAA